MKRALLLLLASCHRVVDLTPPLDASAPVIDAPFLDIIDFDTPAVDAPTLDTPALDGPANLGNTIDT